MPHIHIDFLTVYLVCLAGVLGAVVGSFLDCVAWRRAHGESPWKGRSHCASCGHVLGVPDLVPVFSYLFSGGRCRYCKAKIPADAIIAEAAGAVMFAALFVRFDISFALPQWLIFGSLLLLLSLIDHFQRILPDPLLAAGIVNRLFFLVITRTLREQLPGYLAGALAISGLFLLLVLGMDRLLGRETMGGGDIKLIFVLGLYFDWAEMVLLLLISCILGILGSVLRNTGKGGKKSPEFPFGPYLAMAAGLVALFGRPLVDWYLGLL